MYGDAIKTGRELRVRLQKDNMNTLYAVATCLHDRRLRYNYVVACEIVYFSINIHKNLY